MKILLDSCMSQQLVRGLNKHNISHVNEVMAPDSSDEAVYYYAKKHKMILISSNHKDFCDTGKFPLKDHPGSIILTATKPLRFGPLLELLLSSCKNKSDYAGKRYLLNEKYFKIITARSSKKFCLTDLLPKKKRKSRSRHKGK